MIRATLVAALACAALPLAAQSPTWHVSNRAQLPIADYGVPETDDRLLSIHCDIDGTVLVDPHLFRSEPAERTSLVVTVDGTEYALPASFFEDMANAAWRATATITPDNPVIDALRRGSRATLELRPGSPEDLGPRAVPLTGSSRAIGEALEPCR